MEKAMKEAVKKAVKEVKKVAERGRKGNCCQMQ